MSRGVKAVLPVLILAAALAVSVASGRPARLPGTALGWTPLLYVERAAIGLGAIGTVWLVGWRALHGHFPIKFGNIEYQDELRSSTATVASLEERLEVIERSLDLADKPMQSVDLTPERQ